MTLVPKLPVFGWSAFRGERRAPLPSVIDLPRRQYTTSGRSAIFLALEALGIGAGDHVLVPSYHCPTMIAPIVVLGAQPLFYPIDDHGQPSRAWLDTLGAPGVKALLVAHFFGLPQPMASLRRWCDEQRIFLVEDCAHAFFGRSDGRPVGSWGDAAIASLTKFFAVNEGGCLILGPGFATPSLARCSIGPSAKSALDIVESGAMHGRLRGLNRATTGLLNGLRRLRWRRHEPGAATMRHASEALLDQREARRQMAAPCRWVVESLPMLRNVQRRRDHYLAFTLELSGRTRMRPLLPELPADAAPYVFPLYVDQPDPGYAALRELKAPVSRWDELWPSTPAISGDHGPLWSHHVLQLACHQDMTDADRAWMVETLVRTYEKPA